MNAASMTFAPRLNRSGNANCWGTGCNDAGDHAACVWARSWRNGIGFHQSCYRNFKTSDQELSSVTFSLLFQVLSAMDGSPLWMPSALLPLCAYVRSCFGACSGISFMDSTAWSCVITVVSRNTRCSRSWQREARPRWTGSKDSNYI